MSRNCFALSNLRNAFALSTCVLAMAVCMFAGCGEKGPAVSSNGKQTGGGGQSAEEGTGTTSSDDKKYKIAFVTNQIASFWNISEVGCKDAAQDIGIEAVVKFPPEATATKQKQIVEDLISSGIDAIAISPIDAANQKEMLNGWAAKVPLLTHDSDAPGTDRLMFIGVDNYQAGRTVGKIIKNAMPEGAKMVLTVGRMEQDNAQLRRQGVIDEILDRTPDSTRRDPIEGELSNGNYIIYTTLTDQGKPEVAKQKAEDALNTYSEMNLFVGMFAYNPPACLQAIRQANLMEKVKVAGFDENDATLQGIKDGHVIGTVAQDPYKYGYQSMVTLKKILDGDEDAIPESKYIDCPARPVTVDGRTIGDMKTENVDEFWADLKEKTGE